MTVEWADMERVMSEQLFVMEDLKEGGDTDTMLQEWCRQQGLDENLVIDLTKNVLPAFASAAIEHGDIIAVFMGVVASTFVLGWEMHKQYGGGE